MENLKFLLAHGNLTSYQRSLAIKEFEKLVEKASKYDEIKTKIEGYYKHNNKCFGPTLLEIVANDIVTSFGYKTY